MDLMIPIDRASRNSLVEQVYQGILAAIEDETLGPGQRLPSTREFARQLGITRFTVDDAYSRLVGEGYLEARHGSGTYVAARVRLAVGAPAAGTEQVVPARKLSRWRERLRSSPEAEPATQQFAYDFTSGTPAFDRLPLATWQRLIAREARNHDWSRYSYGHTAGLPHLREAIAAYVGRSRGVTCTPDQVVVTSGSQQSMDLLMRLVLEPGAMVVVENPGYWWVRSIAGLTGATIVPVPVDRDGLVVDALPEPSPDIRLACVTPSHHTPTGAILPLSRRLALLEWAERTGALVLEDDYDGELRYDSRPLPALAALANSAGVSNNVVYVSSFSKVLFPAIRLGYVVLPPDLVEPFVAALATVSRHAPTLNQAVVAAFITEGHFERHLAKMRRLYSARHDALVAAMDAHLAGIAFRDETMTSAGLHVLARFEINLTESEIVARAAAAGIALDGAAKTFMVPPEHPHFFLAYTAMPEEKIQEGIERLARLLRGA
jgi:GntR family transcriptional regulator/MocR family aminotransferase